MKITAFDPVIVSPDADAIVKLFEELGFEKKHTPSNVIEGNEVTSCRMKNADGFHVDVVSTTGSIARDETLIRMNVDDFEAAYTILTARGYRNVREDETIDLKSCKAATMVSPSGFKIAIVKHIKE